MPPLPEKLEAEDGCNTPKEPPTGDGKARL